MIVINSHLTVDDTEIEFQAIRAQGSGGQNVNKVSTAVQLRFDIRASSLPADVKNRLLRYADQRINSDGVIVIKAQETRSQIKNKQEAIDRLRELITHATKRQKRRIPTRPSKGAKERRLQKKNRRGDIKKRRGKVDF